MSRSAPNTRFSGGPRAVTLAALGCLVLIAAAVAALYVSERLRGPSLVDDAPRRATVPAYVPTTIPATDGAIRVLDDGPVAGPRVQVAVSAPAGAQAVRIATNPALAGAEWMAISDVVEVDVTGAGYRTLFGRFLLADGTPSEISVAGVEIDPTYDAAVSSETGAHSPSWIRPLSPTEVVVRVEAGRLRKGSLEPYDLTEPATGDNISKRRGLLVVEREGDVYGIQVSKRTDVIRRPDRLVGRPLEIEAAVEGDWSITSSDDGAYAGPAAPAAIRFVSRPSAIGLNGELKRIHEVVHDIVITLPTAMQPGMTYAVTPPAQIAGGSIRFDPASTISPAVRVNQVGFAPGDQPKTAQLSGWFDDIGLSATAIMEPGFHVVDVETGDIVKRGAGTPRPAPNEMGKGDLTGAPVVELDFSSLTRPGRYRVCVAEIGCSYDFAIDADIWDGLTAAVARAMYHQRSGIELGPPYTAVVRPRPYHPDDGATVQASDYTLLQAQTETGNTDFAKLAAAGTGELVAGAWGGHFDAGDWDRRINHLWYARTAAQLVMEFPEVLAEMELNIPESGDAIPDLLDEALWSVDLFRRMQLPSGAIRGGIEASGHPPINAASWVDDLAVFAYRPDPYASYIYAGVAAEMAVAVEPYDGRRAEELLTSAVAAMRWADDQPLQPVVAEQVAEQRNVAAAAMLLATGDRDWHDTFVSTAAFLDSADPFMSCNAHSRCDAAWIYLQVDPALTEAAIRQDITGRFVASADATVAAAAGTAYGWTTENPFLPLVWGLGSGGAPHASGLLKAYLLTGDETYRSTALQSASVALGSNPMNRTMLTGIGSEPVRSPQITDVKNGGLPPWPGTPVYGHHLLNSLDDDQWVIDDVLAPAGARPDPTLVPYLWQWYDVGSVALFNEFTVHQSHAEALLTFATLAATVAS